MYFSDKAIVGQNGPVINRKTYYLAFVLNTVWYDAFLFCKASLMELLTFESQDELDKFMDIVDKNRDKFQMCPGTFIGAYGVPSTSKWTWLATGEDIKLKFKWEGGSPPSFDGDNCLKIAYDQFDDTVKPYVVGLDCNSETSASCTFICMDTKIVTNNVTFTSTNSPIIDKAKKKFPITSTTPKSGK